MWRLVWLVVFPPEEFQAIIHQGEIEKESVASQAISTMANDLDASFWIVSVNTGQDFVV